MSKPQFNERLRANGAWDGSWNKDVDGSQVLWFTMLWRSPVHLALIEDLADHDGSGVTVQQVGSPINAPHAVFAGPTPPMAAVVTLWENLLSTQWVPIMETLSAYGEDA